MIKKIRILHVLLTNNLGGIESLLCNIDENIDKNKFQLDFIATGRAEYQRKILANGSKIFFIPSEKKIIHYKKAMLNIMNQNYDIIHFNKNSLANCLPIIWANRLKKRPKIIVHSHNTSPSINNLVLKELHKINRKLIRNIPDYRIACSKSAANFMFDKDATVLRNGIDTKKFRFSIENRNDIRKQLDVSPNTVVFGNVGRFSQQKNHERLIYIFNEIQHINPNTKLLLIGDGKLRKKIKDTVQKLKLNNKVMLLGKKTDVYRYLSAMDAVIIPSLYEGLGISAVEAQCSGLPTFVADSIPKEAFVTKHIQSFSLDSDDKEIAKLVLKNVKLLNNVERIEQSKVVAEHGYDIKDTTLKLGRIYEGLVN